MASQWTPTATLIVTGGTFNASFPITTGEPFRGVTDVFMTKLNASGSGLEYSTFLGSGNGDGGLGIAVDANGNAFVTGYASSDIVEFPTTLGAYDETPNGSPDVFVTQLVTIITAHVHNDFNGNGESDILFYNTVSGQISVIGAALVTTLDPAAGDTINATGDFNSDKKADILTYNTITGEIQTLLLNGALLLSTNSITTLNPALEIVAQGTGDFDGDGRDEIVLYKPATGDVGFIYLDAAGTAQIGIDPVIQIPVANDWTLHDTGDFDGDGKDDLLVTNTVSGAVAILFMDGSTLLSASMVLTLNPATGLVVVDVADFNADGKSDLLIQNPATGLTGIATLDGATMISAALVFTMDVAGGETFINAGDYNGDGFSDLLIHNTITGDVTTLLLEDGVVQSQPFVLQQDTTTGWILHSGKP